MKKETEKVIIEEINRYFDRCEEESRQLENIVKTFIKRFKKWWNDEKKEEE